MKFHKFDYEKSKEVCEKCGNIKPNDCYRNVFWVYSHPEYVSKFTSGDWKVAYGYMWAVDNVYVRHCFVVDENGFAIDPTAVLYDREEKDRISFALLDSNKWLDLIMENDCSPCLSLMFWKEEKEIIEYGVKEQLMFIG